MSGTSRPKSVSTSSSSSTLNVKKSQSSAAVIHEPVQFKFNLDSATAHVEEIYTSQVITDLGDSNWKVRLAAMESVQSKVEGLDKETAVSEAHFKFLGNKPGFKDSNFQVISKLLTVLQYISENWSSFNKASAAIVSNGLVEKLGDIKQKKPSSDCLMSFAEKVSISFVFSQSLDAIKNQKSPKIQADQIKWLQTALSEFGVRGVNTRELIETLKVGLSSSNAGVRTSAIATLGTLRLLAGPDVRTLLQDVSSHLLSAIDAEFAKISDQKAPAPTRIQKVVFLNSL